MLVELAEGQRGVARALLVDADAERSALYAPFDGTNPGRVWVDAAAHPQSAFVAAGAVPTDLFFAGNAENRNWNHEVVSLLMDTLLPAIEPQHGAQHVMFYSYTDAWHTALDVLLAPLGARRLERSLFALDHDAFAARDDWRARVQAGMRVVRADRGLAAEIGGIDELWGGPDRFLAHGEGWFVLEGERAVSQSVTVFVGGGHAEVGIQTKETHRRRGLATIAASACIEACLRRGIEPDWGCFYNEASGALARKLGIRRLPNATVHYVRLGAEETG